MFMVTVTEPKMKFLTLHPLSVGVKYFDETEFTKGSLSLFVSKERTTSCTRQKIRKSQLLPRMTFLSKRSGIRSIEHFFQTIVKILYLYFAGRIHCVFVVVYHITTQFLYKYPDCHFIDHNTVLSLLKRETKHSRKRESKQVLDSRSRRKGYLSCKPKLSESIVVCD